MNRLTFTEADRDASGRLLIHPPAQRTLADLLPATQTETDQTPAKTWRPGKLELAGIVVGLVLAAALIAALNTFWPAPAQGTRYPAQPTAAPAPTAAPTTAPTPPSQAAYDAPGGALLGTIPLTATLAYQHSDYPGWGGVLWDGGVKWVETDRVLADLPDLAPPPTLAPRSPSVPASAPASVPAAAPAQPETCDPQVNPRYTSPLRVDPIGSVTGVSCVSQGEADANAVQLAEAMRATADAPEQPTPTMEAR